MTWLHWHALLGAQIERYFPRGTIDPWANELRGDWPVIEKVFRADEQTARPRVEEALRQFINRASWPEDLDDKERVWLNARLTRAQRLTLMLAVPIPSTSTCVEFPAGLTDSELLEWLLFAQWEPLGLMDWIADIYGLFIRVQRDASKPRSR